MVRIRSVVAVVLLVLLAIVGLFLAGALDSLVRIRAIKMAGYNDEWLNHWYGISIVQFPQDLMIYQQIINDTKPDVIVETGTDSGGLALYLATVLRQLNPAGKVLTVDIDARHFNETLATLKAKERMHLLDNVTFFEGSSTASDIFAKIKAAIPPDAKVMVILDSLHTRKHVYDELKLYSELVPVGGYLIVNDTSLEGWWGGDKMSQPMSGIRDFLAEDDRFEIDHAANKFMVSCAPDGFLKRVK